MAEAGSSGAGGGGGAWTVDGTLSSSGSDSTTYTLSGTFDMVRIDIHKIVPASGAAVFLNFNGVEGTEYETTLLDGSDFIGRNVLELSQANQAIYSGSVETMGRWASTEDPPVNFDVSADGDRNQLAVRGAFDGADVGSPLDSLTFSTLSTNITVKARILGADV